MTALLAATAKNNKFQLYYTISLYWEQRQQLSKLRELASSQFFIMHKLLLHLDLATNKDFLL